MTRMTRPDCAVMCGLINTHTHTHTPFVPIFFFGQSAVVVDVGRVGFRPSAVVAGRGVVAVCTRISSQEYVYDK